MATRELPIFPLSIVLFPGTPQLLHVFEPRYRSLLADCLDGDRTFGISYVPAGRSLDPAPQPGEVGCCATVQETRRLPDGRSNILTVGGPRYTLKAWVSTDRPYRIAVIETFDDVASEEPEIAAAAAAVRSAFAEFHHAMQVLTDQAAEPLELTADPKGLSFQVAAALEIEPGVKQELLALRSTSQRLDRLGRILRRLNQDLPDRVAVHTRARGNGQGGDRSQIEPHP